MPLPCRLKPLYQSQGQLSSVEFGELREKQRQRPGGEEKIWHLSM